MKNLEIKKTIISFVIVLYLELLYHLSIFKSFNLKEIFFITIFSLVFSLFINLITSLFSKRINKWLYIFLLSFLCIIFIAQFINFQFYENIISIYSFIHGGQVFEFWSAIFGVFTSNIIYMLLFILPIVLLLVFNKKIVVSKLDFKSIIYKLIIFVIVFIISVLSLNVDKKDIYGAKNLYYYKHVPNSSAQTLGLITTMRLDLERIITNFEERVIINNDTPKEDNKDNKKDKTIKDIHVYMNNEQATEKNEYTGMFKGKNLIAIVAEAFSPIAINEELTPTLYKLTHEGFHFTNFYTPIYYVSTSDGEYVTLTGLLPKEGVWSFYVSRNNYLPYTYGNAFKSIGYQTNAYHNGRYKYYDRNLSHPNMGYNYMACGNGMEKVMNCKPWPQSDLEMINGTFDKYSDKSPFVTY